MISPSPLNTTSPAPNAEPLPIVRSICKSAAILYLLSMLTGTLAALAMSGQVPADGRIALGAHVTSLTGALILLGLAYTMPMMRYGDVGRMRLTWAFWIASFSNWAVSTSKAFLGVHGVGPTGQAANDVVYALLTLFVGVPSILGTIAWISGFRKP